MQKRKKWNLAHLSHGSCSPVPVEMGKMSDIIEERFTMLGFARL
jgi:hypothetical protein